MTQDFFCVHSFKILIVRAVTIRDMKPKIATLRSTILCRGVMIRENRDTPVTTFPIMWRLPAKSWASCTQIFPSGHRVRAPCPNKRHKDCVCHRNNEDTDPHTYWRLASARLINKGKRLFLPECTSSSNRPVSEDEEEDDVFSPGGPYVVVAPANGWCFYICIFRHESRWGRSP